MSNTTHATLLERLREGSAILAWEEFFERYWRAIYAWARGRGCSEHTAEEVVQEVMLTVFHQRDAFRYDPARGRFRDWLATVVRNAVIARRRQPAERVRAQGGTLNAARGPEEPESDAPGPEAAWEAMFEESMLAVLLDVVRREVTPETYQAFELVTFHEMPGAEVAELTGLSRNAVYLARKRVIERLRELGASYRKDGQLDARIKHALEALPDEGVRRSITTRLERTMRGESSR